MNESIGKVKWLQETP